jgi:putative ABC transport system permease protein
VIEGVWVRAAPFPDPSRLVVISARDDSGLEGLVRWSELDYWRNVGAGAFDSMAAYTQSRNVALTIDDQGRLESARHVEPSFFHVLRETPLTGRFFNDEDGAHGSPTAVIITEGLWRTHFGAAEDLESLRVSVDGTFAQVVGVVSERIRTIQSSRVFLPLRAPAAGEDIWNLTALARLSSGRSLRSARAILHTASGRTVDAEPSPRAALVPLRDVVLGADVGRILFVLAAAAALTLLVASGNVFLIIISGMSRQAQELRIKAALGASRPRLVLDLTSKSLVGPILGIVMGLGLSVAALDWLVALMPDTMPRTSEIRLNPGAVIGAVAVSLMTVLAATLLPAMWVSRSEWQVSLRPSREARPAGRTGTLVTAFQAALTVVVLSLAVMLMRSYVGLARIDLGFDPVNLAKLNVLTEGGLHLRGAAGFELEQRALENLRRLRGVIAAGTTDQPPLGGSTAMYSVRSPDTPDGEMMFYYRRVSPGYIEAMGMHIVQGRSFMETDVKGAPEAVVVNESAARLLWSGRDALGRIIYTTPGRPLVVVGVVGDVRSEALDQVPLPEVYRCRLQEPLGGPTFVFRTAAKPGPLLAQLNANPGMLIPGLKVTSPGTFDEAIDRSISQPRFRALIVGLFGFLVLALSIAGVVGLTARAVVARTREIGTRMALGASVGRCVGLLTWQATWPVLAGSLLGALGAVWCTRILQGLVFGLPDTDALSIAGSVVLSLGLTSLGAYIPARRAALVDPVAALRLE